MTQNFDLRSPTSSFLFAHAFIGHQQKSPIAIDFSVLGRRPLTSFSAQNDIFKSLSVQLTDGGFGLNSRVKSQKARLPFCQGKLKLKLKQRDFNS